jgi:hypothetical protein
VVEHIMRGFPSDGEKNPDADLREELQSMEARVRKMRDNRNSLRDQVAPWPKNETLFKNSTENTAKNSRK